MLYFTVQILCKSIPHTSSNTYSLPGIRIHSCSASYKTELLNFYEFIFQIANNETTISYMRAIRALKANEKWEIQLWFMENQIWERGRRRRRRRRRSRECFPLQFLPAVASSIYNTSLIRIESEDDDDDDDSEYHTRATGS